MTSQETANAASKANLADEPVADGVEGAEA